MYTGKMCSHSGEIFVALVWYSVYIEERDLARRKRIDDNTNLNEKKIATKVV